MELRVEESTKLTILQRMVITVSFFIMLFIKRPAKCRELGMKNLKKEIVCINARVTEQAKFLWLINEKEVPPIKFLCTPA